MNKRYKKTERDKEKLNTHKTFLLFPVCSGCLCCSQKEPKKSNNKKGKKNFWFFLSLSLYLCYLIVNIKVCAELRLRAHNNNKKIMFKVSYISFVYFVCVSETHERVTMLNGIILPLSM